MTNFVCTFCGMEGDVRVFEEHLQKHHGHMYNDNLETLAQIGVLSQSEYKAILDERNRKKRLFFDEKKGRFIDR